MILLGLIEMTNMKFKLFFLTLCCLSISCKTTLKSVPSGQISSSDIDLFHPASLDNLWKNPKIKTCWKDIGSKYSEQKKSYEKAIQVALPKLFEFSGWQDCSNDDDANIRIRFGNSQQYAVIGSNQLNRNPSFPPQSPFTDGETFYMNPTQISLDPSCEARLFCDQIAFLHEMGHALGLNHESDRLDWEKAPNYGVFQGIPLEYLSPRARYGQTYFGTYSENSIMSYYGLKAALLLDKNDLENIIDNRSFKLLEFLYTRPIAYFDFSQMNNPVDGVFERINLKVKSSRPSINQVTMYRYKIITSDNAYQNRQELLKESESLMSGLSDDKYKETMNNMNSKENIFTDRCENKLNYSEILPLSTPIEFASKEDKIILVKVCVLGGVENKDGRIEWQPISWYSTSAFWMKPPSARKDSNSETSS